MPKEYKNKPIFVKASKSEHSAFRKLAEKRHTNLSELIRQLLHRELDSQKVQAA
jgi:hypothetical protein